MYQKRSVKVMEIASRGYLFIHKEASAHAKNALNTKDREENKIETFFAAYHFYYPGGMQTINKSQNLCRRLDGVKC